MNLLVKSALVQILKELKYFNLLYIYRMAELTDKETTIKNIYYNVVSGYGSKRDTYLQANKIDSSIRYVDVKEY